MAPSTAPKGITSQNVGSTVAEPWSRSPKIPSPPPVAAAVAPLAAAVVAAPPALVAGAALATLVTAATVGAYIDLKNAENSLQKAKNNAERVNSRPVNTGDKRSQGIPPFTGGQTAGMQYVTTYSIQAADGRTFNGVDENVVIGKILNFDRTGGYFAQNHPRIYTDSGSQLIANGYLPLGLGHPITILSLQFTPRSGLLDTGGNPAPIGGGEKINEGYNGSQSKRPAIPDFYKGIETALGAAPQKPKAPFTKGIAPALGIGSPAKEPSTGNPSSSAPRKNLAPSPTTAPPAPATTPKAPPTSPQPSDKDKPKSPFIPPTPATPDDIRKDLIGIAAIIALIGANTEPAQQKANAKAGSCEALNSPECTNNLKNDIKEPILNKVNQNAGLISGLGATLSGINAFLTNSIFPKLVKIQEFAEGVAKAAKLDKVYNFLTFITVIHNASMLSSSLATTLMDTLSLGLATGGIKDADDSPINIQEILNKTVENKVKEIIGANYYGELSTRWKAAVRVYQAAANIAYQMRSLWDSARSLAELTGANVGKIGNALRRDGAVSENAYTAMADNPLMVNSAMTRLQNLEEAASHLNSITSEAYSVTETVAQIKKDHDDFKKLVKESQPLVSIPNDAAKAKDDAAKIASVSPNITNIDLVKP